MTVLCVKNWSRERDINISNDSSHFVKGSVKLSALHNRKCCVISLLNAIRRECVLKGDKKRYCDNDELSNTTAN